MSLFGYAGLLNTIEKCHRILGGHGSGSAGSFPPASETAVANAELRLGSQLPHSYREFLLTSNGCGKLHRTHGGLLPVEQIGWFRNLEPEWVRIWTQDNSRDVSEEEHLQKAQNPAYLRRAYLPELLQIGESYDGSVYLLNPCVRTADGEWEAWDFANWYPGAKRFPSFRDLLDHVADSLNRTVYLETVELNEDELMETALVGTRARIEDGEDPQQAVMMYLSKAGRDDELIFAWSFRSRPHQRILRALGY